MSMNDLMNIAKMSSLDDIDNLTVTLNADINVAKAYIEILNNISDRDFKRKEWYSNINYDYYEIIKLTRNECIEHFNEKIKAIKEMLKINNDFIHNIRKCQLSAEEVISELKNKKR